MWTGDRGRQAAGGALALGAVKVLQAKRLSCPRTRRSPPARLPLAAKCMQFLGSFHYCSVNSLMPSVQHSRAMDTTRLALLLLLAAAIAYAQDSENSEKVSALYVLCKCMQFLLQFSIHYCAIFTSHVPFNDIFIAVRLYLFYFIPIVHMMRLFIC
jgi:hypothetical protein